MSAPPSSPTDARAVSTSRLLAAPPAAVWAAIATPERLARWWGPTGFSNRFEVCDLRPDGVWRFTMLGPDGASYPNTSRFVAVDPEKRLLIHHDCAPLFDLDITLTPEGPGTRVGWVQTFATAELCTQLAAIVVPANEQNLDRLDAEVGRTARD